MYTETLLYVLLPIPHQATPPDILHLFISIGWYFRQFLQRAQKDSCQLQVNSHDHQQQPHLHQQARELSSVSP